MSLLLAFRPLDSGEVTSTATFAQAAGAWSATAAETITSTATYAQTAAWAGTAAETLATSGTWTQTASWSATAAESIATVATFAQSATWAADAAASYPTTAAFDQSAASWAATAGEALPTTGAWTQTAAWSAVAAEAIASEASFEQTQTWRAVSTDAAYAALVVSDSPVAYYRLGEASGEVIDQMGGPSGTANGTVTRDVTGALLTGDDGAVTLDGSTGYIDVPDHAALDTGDVFTLEVWGKRDALGPGTADTFLLAKGDGGYRLGFNNDGVEIAQKAVAIIAISTVQIQDTTTYHHIVWTKDGATNVIYIDGVDRTGPVTDSTIVSTAHPLEIGRSNEYFDGSVDEVAIYGYALSPEQVAAHYEAATSISSIATFAQSATWDAAAEMEAVPDVPSGPTGGAFIVGPAYTRTQRPRIIATAAFGQQPARWAAYMETSDDEMVLELLELAA
jgi:hypothetical protein